MKRAAVHHCAGSIPALSLSHLGSMAKICPCRLAPATVPPTPPRPPSKVVPPSTLAAECGVHLTVGMAIHGGGSIYDAQLLYGPDRRLLATYHKAHLFAAEREWYSAGDTPRWWRRRSARSA